VHITGLFCFAAQEQKRREKSCPAFTGQTNGGISMKLRMSDHTLFLETYVFITMTLIKLN
jgi:hypothetical protein